MPDELSKALANLERDRVIELLTSRIQKGEKPLDLLEECRQGMVMVGERFHQGDYFLAELVLSGEIFKEVTAMLRPHLTAERSSKPLGKVVLATPRGDIHELGKNILAMLLEARGFEVHDLGVDVNPELVVERVEQIGPEVVGFSALMTPACVSMKEAVEKLQKAGLRRQVKLMIGGGVTTPLVKEYVGADLQTRDAMEAVEYCLRIAGSR